MFLDLSEKSFQLRWTCLPTPCKSWQPQQESRVKLREATATVATANKFLTKCHNVTSFWDKIHKSFALLNCKILDSGVPYDQESNFHVWKPVTILTKASRFAKRVKWEQKTWLIPARRQKMWRLVVKHDNLCKEHVVQFQAKVLYSRTHSWQR